MFAHPSNLFVAGFIGSPIMNFLQVHITVVAGEARFSLFGQHMNVPVMGRLPNGLARPVIVGIRPEHLHEAGNDQAFSFQPTRVENLGSEQVVHTAIPEEHRLETPLPLIQADSRRATLLMRLLNTRPVEFGQPLSVSFDPVNLHYFDPRTHKSLAGGISSP
jgi:ABC-type sugar transport system ATPase subunit